MKMKRSTAYTLSALIGLTFWLLLLNAAFGATVPSTGFLVRANCSSISNPVTNSTACLQTTTTGGRTAGQVYVWTGAAYTQVTGGGGAVPVGPITTSGLTQATGKLLGRGTAATGAIEEITVGTNLSLSGTTLNASAGAGGYATIQDEGSDLTQRTKVNFIGAGVACVDNGGATRTDCTIAGSGGSTVPDVLVSVLNKNNPSPQGANGGNATFGPRFRPLKAGLSAKGVSIHWNGGIGATTLKVYLATNGSVTSITTFSTLLDTIPSISVNADAIYTADFPSGPIALTQYQWYWVGVYEASGAKFLAFSDLSALQIGQQGGTNGATILPNGINLFGRGYHAGDSASPDDYNSAQIPVVDVTLQ